MTEHVHHPSCPRRHPAVWLGSGVPPVCTCPGAGESGDREALGLLAILVGLVVLAVVVLWLVV